MINDLSIKILKALKKPLTTRELAIKLNTKYKKIHYSITFLYMNGLVEKSGYKKTLLKKINATLWKKKM